MKTNLYNCFRALLMTGVLISPPLVLSACAGDEIQRPDVTMPLAPELGPEGMEGTISLSDIQISTPFNSGYEGVHSYRIPAITTTKDGSLLAFGEARYETWKDISYTDAVVKRSTDGGKTWSAMVNLTAAINGGAYAFMDPAPVVDKETGTVFVFISRWIKNGGRDAALSRAFLVTSNDNGVTWSTPVDVSSAATPAGYNCMGFGPGSGFQIESGSYAGRLIMPVRLQTPDLKKNPCVTLYSDNGGNTWLLGTPTMIGSEFQIADCGRNTLTINMRTSGGRRSAMSKDGGVTWGIPALDPFLAAPGKGCQASVLGVGGTKVLFCGPAGGEDTPEHDDRRSLTLYRSLTGASGWTKSQILYDKASSYSGMTLLPDGRLAIIFEAGDHDGFLKEEPRQKGWMRLDVMVLPKEVTDNGYWFEEK